MLLWTILSVIGVVTVSAVLFAGYAERRYRREADRLRGLAPGPAPDVAYRGVVNARSAFTRAVQIYEEAIAALPTTAGPQGSMAGSAEGSGAGDIRALEAKKNDRRERLLGAQRLWEQVRPGSGPSSPVDVWLGIGRLNGWNFGLVGFESAIVRLEHALDPDCWVVIGTRRFRFGPAFGVEQLRLGVLIEGARIDQVTGLLQSAMASPEIALRPGTSLARLFGGRRTRSRNLLEALQQSVSERSNSLALQVGAEPRGEALRYLAMERGLSLTDPHAGLARPSSSISLRIGSSGPAFLIGAWAGRRPDTRILAGSNHQPWIRR